MRLLADGLLVQASFNAKIAGVQAHKKALTSLSVLFLVGPHGLEPWTKGL
jgi:hypothetical protein